MKSVDNGRNLLIVMMVIILFMEIVTVINGYLTYWFDGRMDLANNQLMRGGFRFVMTVVLMFFLYKGYRWAKWYTVASSIFGVVLVLLVQIAVLLQFVPFNLLLVLFGIIEIAFFLILILSKSVNDFFLYQRGALKIDLDENEDI